MTYDVDRDYITINPSYHPQGRWNVVIMTTHHHDGGGLQVSQVSEQLPRAAADALAKSWAAATGLKVLP